MVEFEVIKTFYLKVIEVVDAREEPIKLKLEVLKSCKENTYHPRVYRLETYEIRYAFGKNEIWAKELLIVDEHADWNEVVCNSVDEVLQTVESLIFPNREA